MAEIDSTVLIDSVIMIDHFNGVPAATEYLLRMQGKLAISVITFAEVLTGFLMPAAMFEENRLGG